jgi:hypothetical protein
MSRRAAASALVVVSALVACSARPRGGVIVEILTDGSLVAEA